MIRIILFIQLYHYMQVHRVRLLLRVSEVHITVKFPCTVRLIFRVGGNEVESPEKAKLENGVAYLTKTMLLNVDASFNGITNSYVEKKAVVTVYLISANGTNMAGLYTFDLSDALNQGSNVSKTVGLERCPDKSSYVSLNLKYEVMDSDDIFKVEDKEANLTDNFISKSEYDPFVREDPRRSLKKDTVVASKFEQRSVRDGSPGVRLNKTMGVKNRLELFKNEEDDSRVVERMKLDLMDRDRKLTRLEMEKQNYQLENSTLKSQVEGFKTKGLNKSFRESEMSTENDKLKKKCEALQMSSASLQQIKERYEQLQTEKGEVSRVKKTLEAEVQEKSLQLKEREDEVRELKREKNEVERQAREKARVCKEHTDQLQDVQANLANLQKRFENKENFYKEEMKKLNDKLIDAQQHKHKLTLSLEDTTSENQEKEVRIQGLLKEKDKLINEDKQKLTKKYEHLKGEFDRLLGESEADKQEMLRKGSESDTLRKTLGLQEIEIASFKEELDRLRKQVSSGSTIKAKLEEESREKNALIQKHLSLQKTLDEELEESRNSAKGYLRQLEEKADLLHSHNDKSTDLQRRLKEKESKVVEMETEVESLRKKVETLRKAQDKQVLEIEDASLSNNKLKNELESARMALEEAEECIRVERTRFSEQSESLKKQVKKLFEEVESTRFKLELSHQEVNKVIQQKNMWIEKEQIANNKYIKLETRWKESQGEVNSKDLSEKQLNENIRELEHELKNSIELLNKETDKVEELKILQTRAKRDLTDKEHLIVQQADNVKRLQSNLAEKEADLKHLQEKLATIQMESSQTKMELGNTKEELRGKNTELVRDRQIIENLKKEVASTKQELRAVEEVLNSSRNQVSGMKNEGNLLVRDKSALEFQLERAKSQLQKYKKNSFSSMTILLQELSKSDSTADRLVEEVFDYDVSKLQVQALTVVKQMRDKYESRVNILSLGGKNLAQEIELLKSKNSALQHSTHQLNEELRFLIMQKEEIDKEYEVSTEKLEDFDRVTYTMAEEMKQLEQRIRELAIQNQQLQTTLDFKEQHQQEKEQEIQVLERELLELREQAQDQLARSKVEDREKESRLKKEIEDLDTCLNSRLKDKTTQATRLEEELKKVRLDNQKANLNIQRLETRMAELGNDIKDKTEDLVHNSRREKELIDKVKDSERRTLEYETKIETQIREIADLEQKLASRDKTSRGLEKDKEGLGDIIKQVRKELAEQQNTLEHTQMECHNLAEELENLKEKNSLNVSQKNQVNDELANKASAIKDLLEQINTHKETIAKKDKLVQDKDLQIQELNQKQSLDKAEYKEALVQMEMKKEGTDTNLKKELNLKQQLQKEIQKMSSDFTLEYKKLTTENQDLRSQIDSLQGEIFLLKGKELESAVVLEGLQKELIQNKIAFNSSVNDLNKKEQASAQELRQKIKQQQETIRKYEEKANTLQTGLKEKEEFMEQQKERFKESMSKISESTVDLNHRIKEIQVEKANEEAKVMHATEEVEVNKRQLRKQEDNIHQLESKLKEEIARQEEYKIQCEDLRRKVLLMEEEAIEAEKNSKKVLTHLEDTAKREAAEIAELKRAIEKNKKDLQQNRKENESLTSRNTAEMQSQRGLESEIERLTQQLISGESSKNSEVEELRRRISKEEQRFKELEEKFLALERQLFENQNYLEQLKVMKNPGHKYLGEIKESVSRHQSEKRFLKETLLQFQAVNKGALDRIKSMQRELSLVNQEKTKVLYKVREFETQLLRSKSKAISRANSSEEKEQIVDDYSQLQNKANDLINFGFAILQADRISNRDTSIMSDTTIKRMNKSRMEMSQVSGSSSQVRHYG